MSFNRTKGDQEFTIANKNLFNSLNMTRSSNHTNMSLENEPENKPNVLKNERSTILETVQKFHINAEYLAERCAVILSGFKCTLRISKKAPRQLILRASIVGYERRSFSSSVILRNRNVLGERNNLSKYIMQTTGNKVHFDSDECSIELSNWIDKSDTTKYADLVKENKSIFIFEGITQSELKDMVIRLELNSSVKEIHFMSQFDLTILHVLGSNNFTFGEDWFKHLKEQDKAENQIEKPGKISFLLSYDIDKRLLCFENFLCRYLKAMDYSGLSDPYVEIAHYLDRAKVACQKTPPCKSELNPDLMSKISFKVNLLEIAQSVFVVSVFDYDTLSKDDLIGKFSFGYNDQGHYQLIKALSSAGNLEKPHRWEYWYQL